VEVWLDLSWHKRQRLERRESASPQSGEINNDVFNFRGTSTMFLLTAQLLYHQLGFFRLESS
ncbi:MAG TPA: hypothetical protein DCP31_39125, partial [Cyanobacteria bacterium UBA8543]|nr:hypothetical protein [Cyanobacteria bacterium UBA8543]